MLKLHGELKQGTNVSEEFKLFNISTFPLLTANKAGVQSESNIRYGATNNEATLAYFLPGRVVSIYGKAPDSGTFDIDFSPEAGSYGALENAICLRLSVDIENYHITRNSFAHGDIWFAPEDEGYTGLLPGRFFSITVTVQIYSYEINVNGYHFATYYHRVPYVNSMVVQVDSGVKVDPIEYN